MNTLRNRFTLVTFLLTKLLLAQELPIDVVAREVNRQIFDTDGQLPGFYTLTNKYHEFNYGKIKSETIVWSSPDERVIRHFNQQGSMVKYQVYLNDKLRSDFTYEYGADGISLLKERGTYNLDYYLIDSFTLIGLPVLGEGKGFNFDLDTLFVLKSKFKYELTRKRKSGNKPVDKYVISYNKNGNLKSVDIFEDEIQVGHFLNKYNELNQVTERQDFWDYERFANENEWIVYLANRVYKFSYDSNGFIQFYSTEIYNPIDRKWEIEVKDFQCSMQQDGNQYKAYCTSNRGEYIKVEIDQYANWTRKEEYSNDELKISSREITYYE